MKKIDWAFAPLVIFTWAMLFALVCVVAFGLWKLFSGSGTSSPTPCG
jgi:hypothetical protein